MSWSAKAGTMVDGYPTLVQPVITAVGGRRSSCFREDSAWIGQRSKTNSPADRDGRAVNDTKVISAALIRLISRTESWRGCPRTPSSRVVADRVRPAERAGVMRWSATSGSPGRAGWPQRWGWVAVASSCARLAVGAGRRFAHAVSTVVRRADAGRRCQQRAPEGPSGGVRLGAQPNYQGRREPPLLLLTVVALLPVRVK